MNPYERTVMTDNTYATWRQELTNCQTAIDELEDAYYDKVCDETLTESDLAKAEIEYKIERRRLVAKLEAHYKSEPAQ